MSPTLLPCPFCGSGNVDAVGSSGTCRNCWADGPSRDSRTSAIAAWNARVPSRAAVRAEVLREVAAEFSDMDGVADWCRARAEKEERDGA